MNPVHTAKRCGQIIRAQGVASLFNVAWTRLYTLRRQPSDVRGRPVWAQIETTNACNLRCRMCAQSADAWRSAVARKSLPFEEFEHILRQLPWIQFALLNGVGEPLLNRDLPKMIRHAHGKGIRTGFFTNATLLTPDLARELVECEGLANVALSIDGGTPRTFEKIRIGAKYDEVCANIENLIRIRDEHGRSTPQLTVWMVAMPEVIDEIPELIRTVRRIGARNLTIKHLLASDVTEGEQVSEAEARRIEGYRSLAAEQGVELCFSRMPPGNVNRTETRTCLDPWRMVYVNASGWINPCCFSFGDESTYFGNILETDFEVIWNSEPFREFRRELRTGMPDCCRTCPKHSTGWVGSDPFAE